MIGPHTKLARGWPVSWLARAVGGCRRRRSGPWRTGSAQTSPRMRTRRRRPLVCGPEPVRGGCEDARCSPLVGTHFDRAGDFPQLGRFAGSPRSCSPKPLPRSSPASPATCISQSRSAIHLRPTTARTSTPYSSSVCVDSGKLTVTSPSGGLGADADYVLEVPVGWLRVRVSLPTSWSECRIAARVVHRDCLGGQCASAPARAGGARQTRRRSRGATRQPISSPTCGR